MARIIERNFLIIVEKCVYMESSKYDWKRCMIVEEDDREGTGEG